MTTPVSNNQAQANSSSSAAVSANGDISQMFTTLLVAQIKNQDPLQPTDPSKFVNQLTQLSQLQSLQALSTQGSTANGMLQSLQTLSLGAQVGSVVTASASSVVLGTQPVYGRVTLANSNATVSLVLQNAAGQQQRISLGSQSAGSVPFTIDPASLGIPAGTYRVSVETDSGETPTAEVAGTITSVQVSPTQGVVLDVSNLGEISQSAITAFYGRQSSGQ